MAENQKLKAPKEEDTEREGAEISKTNTSSSSSSSFSLSESARVDGSSAGAELSQAETLVAASCCPSTGNDHGSGCDSLSKPRNDGVHSPAENSLSAGGEDVKPTIPTPSASLNSGFKGQFGISHQQLLASVTAQAAHNQAQMEVQTGYPPSASDLLPASLKQSISSPINPTPPQPTLQVLPQDNDGCISKLDRQNSFDQQMKPSNVAVKAPPADGYNWRKYGQKLVKSNESSRSYYRCTQTNCHAKKKVEHCDHSGCVLAIIYKGRHNHEPPRKIRCTKARRSISSMGTISSDCPSGGSGSVDQAVKKLNDSDPSASTREPRHTKPEKQLQSSSRCDHNTSVKAEKEHDDEPNAKRRVKEGDIAYSAPLFKAVKEPKIVVQAAGDVGISGDGYRWRKYGQKMVKGNPNPRSYYKCTSAGCPVRKHVERAIDGTTTIIITYEGKHDHDMPVPKKRHGPPSAGLLIAAAAAINGAQLKKSEALASQKNSTQWSMDVEGESASEKASELGGEKALESARTLLSIGIELRPY